MEQSLIMLYFCNFQSNNFIGKKQVLPFCTNCTTPAGYLQFTHWLVRLQINNANKTTPFSHIIEIVFDYEKLAGHQHGDNWFCCWANTLDKYWSELQFLDKIFVVKHLRIHYFCICICSSSYVLQNWFLFQNSLLPTKARVSMVS